MYENGGCLWWLNGGCTMVCMRMGGVYETEWGVYGTEWGVYENGGGVYGTEWGLWSCVWGW